MKALAALLPTLLLGGCLSTEQQQALATGACAGAAVTYAQLPASKKGPKTQADFGAIQALCNGDTTTLFVNLAEAFKAYNLDKAAGL